MKTWVMLVILLIFVSSAQAQFHDHDGLLEVQWLAPAYGNPLDHYVWTYTVNGVADSVSGESISGVISDNSVTLTNIGDWSVFEIYAVSIMNDTSIAVVSDTAFYSLGTGIGPPQGVTWIQGP